MNDADATAVRASGPGASGRHSSFAQVILSWRRWWRDSVIGTVDQQAVIEDRREEAYISPRYMFMTAMSGGIAILGMLLSSPAVVIGAMLLSPLMGPIIGLGFALATGDFRWLRQAARALIAGTAMAAALCALIVFFSPLQTVTPEIAARTRPNLFDLMVALFSAMAGAYALIRGKEGTIVGVAIATALMPPIAAVGFGLATLNWTVFSGALWLYVTNLVAIALTATVMARLYGFRTTLTSGQSKLQNFAIVAVLIGLAVPLGYQLLQIAWESNSSRTIRTEILDEFDNRARLSQIEIDWEDEPILIDATVLTPELRSEAETRGERSLAQALGRPVDLVLTQYKVGTTAQAAEQAQLAAARAREEAAAIERAKVLAARLALVAGVPEDEVLIDRENRRALVRARELDGAPLASYRMLEARIAATEPEWRIELLPPVRPLPVVPFAEGEPTPAGLRAIRLIAWAAPRVDAPIVLVGPRAQAERVSELLGERAVEVERIEPGSAPLRARWGEPENGD